jgi:predicted permease
MNITAALVGQIMSMTLIASSGFLLSKLKLVNKVHSKGLTIISVNLLAPCIMLNAFQTNIRIEKIEGMVASLIAAILIHAVYMLVTLSMSHHGILATSGERASVLYNNALNLVFPLIIGTLGSEYIFYSTSYIFVQNMLIWTYGNRLMGSKKKVTIKMILTTPIIAGMLLGLFLFFTGITLPPPLGKAVSSLGACHPPVSMLVIGMLLTEIDFKKAFAVARLYRVVFIRLIALPVLAMAVLLGVEILWSGADARNILTVTLLCAVGPTAVSVTQLAQINNSSESGYVSSINAVSTVFSILTIPLMSLLYQSINF